MSAGLHFFSVCLEHSAGVTDEQRATHQTLKPISVYLGKLQGEGREAEEGGGRREADEGGGRREAEEERGGGRGECVNNYLSLLDQSLRPAGGKNGGREGGRMRGREREREGGRGERGKER